MASSIPEKAKAEPDPLAEQIGREIQRARTAKNVSVSELHRQTGISRTVLQGYEAGKYKPGARELRLLSESLDVSPNKLLFGRDVFRDSTAIDAVLGNADKALNASRLGIIFAALSIEEQRAILSVVMLMAEARFGGRQQLAQVLQVSEALMDKLGSLPPGELEKRMASLMTGDPGASLDDFAAGLVPPSPPENAS